MSFFSRKNLDFLAVGDIVSDAFIKLHDAHVDCDKENGTCELAMSYGNKVPYEFVEIIRAVGNSANAAVAAARLGLNSSLVASIGDDEEGEKATEQLEKEKVGTDYLLVNKGKKTNYHYVLWYENDRTILVKHEEFKYNFPQTAKPKWIYLSSLGEHAVGLHEEIITFIQSHPETKLAFQPGTFQMKMGIEKLKKIYEKTDLFFCNVEEARLILGKDGNAEIKDLLSSMRILGPKTVVITDGPNGAYADDGTRQFFLNIYPQDPAYERTGAGDAFASTTTTCLIKGLSLEDSMKWASINSMSVCKQVGAQKGLLKESEIKNYFSKAPVDWNIKII